LIEILIRAESFRPFLFPERESGGVIVNRRRIFVAGILMNKRLKVNIYVIPVTLKKVPYGIVIACMN